MSTIEQPDFTYENDRKILLSEIIDLQNKMSTLTKKLQEVVSNRGQNLEELKNTLHEYGDEILFLEKVLRRLREISGPRSKTEDSMSIN